MQSASVLKTKELTQTRIQRALLHIILGIHQVPDNVPYARVLGFRRESSFLLKEIKTNSRIPVITKLADAPSLARLPGSGAAERNDFCLQSVWIPYCTEKRQKIYS